MFLVFALVSIGASGKQARPERSAGAPATVDVKVSLPELEPSASQEASTLAPTTAPLPGVGSAETATSPAAYQMTWYSINGGGAINASSTNYQMGLSVGQSVAGAASGTNYDMGIGFWYGAAAGGGCPIVVSGDVNLSSTVTSSDIIVVVNFVFKGGSAPLPCTANGDVNCSGTVTSADIITLVNFVFKGGAAPCNTCTSPLAASC
jgi:hypothetical protein